MTYIATIKASSCDTRSHQMSGATKALPGKCPHACSRPFHASLATAGCEARGKAQERPTIGTSTGEGKTGRVTAKKSSLRLR